MPATIKQLLGHPGDARGQRGIRLVVVLDCAAAACLWRNGKGVCGVPSKAGVGADGRCAGFAEPPEPTGKRD